MSEPGLAGRVEALEERLELAVDTMADLAASTAPAPDPRPRGPAPVWGARLFNPLVIVDASARAQAWERLYAFVELLNSTFGAQRTPTGAAPLYIRAGWWANPLAVMHLAALCEAWVEASFTLGDPLGGGHDMLAVLMDRVMPVLELVCGRRALQWSQQADDVSFSLDPPAAIAQVEARRRADFEAFVAADRPVAARTALGSMMAEALDPHP